MMKLSRDADYLPVRRWFEAQWEHAFPANSSNVERLSALNTEIRMRLFLPNDYLFKVDMASMRSSLEVRVPMLDEDLIAFGLTLPHALKVHGGSCKRVLRGVAGKRLPYRVMMKEKQGFGIPVDQWVDDEFRSHLREILLGTQSHLPEFFRPEVYKPIVESFCSNQRSTEISRAGLFGRVIMLLSLELCFRS
jgi:asparagine synthase (glutamine-hydrolysing)